MKTLSIEGVTDLARRLKKENRGLKKLIIDAIAHNERILAASAEYKRQAIEYANELEQRKHKHTSNCPAREDASHKLVERGWNQCTCSPKTDIELVKILKEECTSRAAAHTGEERRFFQALVNILEEIMGEGGEDD